MTVNHVHPKRFLNAMMSSVISLICENYDMMNQRVRLHGTYHAIEA